MEPRSLLVQRYGKIPKVTTKVLYQILTLFQDPIDEFKPGDAFFEQILVMESATADIKAIREQYRKVQSATLGIDLDKLSLLDLSISERFPGHLRTSSTESDVSIPATQIGLDDIGTNTSFEKATSPSRKDHLSYPVLSTPSIYLSMNHSNFPGLSHPGFSTDTRGGGMGFPGGPPGSRAPHTSVPSKIAGKKFQSNCPRWVVPSGSHGNSQAQKRQPVDLEEVTAQQYNTKYRPRSRIRRPRREKTGPLQGFQHGSNEIQRHTLPLVVLSGSPPKLHSVMRPALPPAPHRAAIGEYHRWQLVKENLIVVPQVSRDSVLPSAYIIDPVETLNHPNIIEIRGPRSDWAWLLAANINHSDDGNRSLELENILNAIIYGSDLQSSSVSSPPNPNIAAGGYMSVGSKPAYTHPTRDDRYARYKNDRGPGTSPAVLQRYPADVMSCKGFGYGGRGADQKNSLRSEVTAVNDSQGRHPEFREFLNRGCSVVHSSPSEVPKVVQHSRSFPNSSWNGATANIRCPSSRNQMNLSSTERTPSPYRRISDALHRHGLESRQSSPGFLNIARSRSQIFDQPVRPFSAAGYQPPSLEDKLRIPSLFVNRDDNTGDS